MATATKLPPPGLAQKSAWPARLAILAVFVWILGVSFTAQLTGWLGPALGVRSDAIRLAFGATLAQASLLILPLLYITWRWKTARYRAAYQAWLMAALYLLLLSPGRQIPSVQSQLAMTVQLAITAFYLWLFLFITWRRQLPPAQHHGSWIAVSSAMVFALPWVAWGALGSPLDVLLGLLLSLAFGMVASRVFSHHWLASLVNDSRGPVRDLLAGGAVLGTMLLIMVSGLGLNGIPLALMTALPALGWVIMAMAGLGVSPGSARNRYTVALLIGLTTAAILLFSDSDGMVLQALDPILAWTIRASSIALLIGWLLALSTVAASLSLPSYRSQTRWTLVGALLVVVLTGVYALGGQGGFHGDRIFVILNHQANLSQASTIQDYDTRRRFVYDELVAQATASQADLRATLDSLGVDYTPYYLVNALEVQGGLIHRLWLNTRSDVARVLPSPTLRPPQKLSRPAQGSAQPPGETPWNLIAVGAPQARQDFAVTGKGIVIGHSDSGVQFDHPELLDSYRGKDDGHDGHWLDPWFGSSEPVDLLGHGTHTLGTVLGNNVGVAPDATWYACANLGRNLGNPARYLDCLQFMLAPYPQGGDPFVNGDPTRSAHILNNSWGCPEDYEGCDGESLLPAVQALRAAGIFVVVSAGNTGPACGTVADPPAIYEEVVSVGAIDSSRNLVPFSSRGPVTVDGSGRVKPDIVAPGLEVLSAFPGDTYEITSGTSMAGPHVVGTVALMWSANPSLLGDIESTEQILGLSARPLPSHPDDTISGAGLTDLSRELERSSPVHWPQTAASDCPSQDQGAGVPNNHTGFGVVDAHAAVQMAIAW